MTFITINHETASNLVKAMPICAICLQDLYHPMFYVPCLHFYCGACAETWLGEGNGKCPECREEVQDTKESVGLTNMSLLVGLLKEVVEEG
jgi:hypothetical protein